MLSSIAIALTTGHLPLASQRFHRWARTKALISVTTAWILRSGFTGWPVGERIVLRPECHPNWAGMKIRISLPARLGLMVGFMRSSPLFPGPRP